MRVERGPRFLALIGHMGAGKTTVGSLLATRLGWEFIDLDREIEREQAKSVAEIFGSQGEAGFRVLELAKFQEVVNDRSRKRTVIALGGGAMSQAQIRELIAFCGATLVFLDAPVNELLERCRRQRAVVRPLAQDEAEFQRLLQTRREHYETADFTVQTGGRTPAQVVEEIENWIHGVIH